jgi:subtilisin family serine protease
MARIDRYLLHTFETLKDVGTPEIHTAAPAGPAASDLLPMLVRVVHPAEIPKIMDIQDCQVTSEIGNIVACLGSLATIEALAGSPWVISVEASRPTSGFDCGVSVPFVHADKVHNDPQQPEKGDHALVALIDGGIDVLHQAFQDKNKNTRIASIWDQTDSSAPGPTVQGRSLYGTLHTKNMINGYITAGTVPKGLGRDPRHHGTHVGSIAAGQSAGKFCGGMAPESQIVVVIPRIRVNSRDPFSVGYSNSHVDALSFIDSEANRLNLPVVVNVSLGMNAGAHDGTSNLEAAFDNFSGGGRVPGRVVVKSAGNERGKDGHAQLKMANQQVQSLTWTSLQSHAGPDVIELWFRACDDHKLRLFDPSQGSSQFVEANESKGGNFPSGYRFDISYEKFHWDNGDSRVLVSISSGQNLSIAAGNWRLDIEAKTVLSDGLVHAWIERDDTRPIRFTSHQWEEFTLSIPGTARTVVAVASVAPAIPWQVASYSSYGPTRDEREKPDLAAPGESIEAAKAGTLQDVEVMSGTSMAAPHVTGAIALLLSRQEKLGRAAPAGGSKQFNAAQIRAALSQTSQNFSGRPTPSMGYGVLDAQKFLATLK